MILILGGTTEGRIATQTIDQAGKPFYYSTRGDEQLIESKNGIRLTGKMEPEEMVAFCRDNDIRLLVDAAHPFAIQLHSNVAQTAQICQIPVVRLERRYPRFNEACIACQGYDDAVVKMKKHGVRRLLALTGVQTIGKLSDYWKEATCFFRILDRNSSFLLAKNFGFPSDNLLVYEPEVPIAELIEAYQADAIITKESGGSGGFEEKQIACLEKKIPLFVVKRPILPSFFHTVTGEFGLRKAIEQFVPDFFPLRIGFTTGSCATVASKVALLTLLGKGYSKETDFLLPNGEEMCMRIDRIEKRHDSATAYVTKDAGDDPDVIHGQSIVSTVSFNSLREIRFLQGLGVGTVTLPGIGLPIGGPAINKVPRQMITQALTALYKGGLDVTISVPNGKEIAEKTFNPKLGIVNGISILGTLGIVRPFSLEAWTESIEREIEVAIALQAERIVINSGAKSERYVKQRYPDLPSQAFIHYGNFIGITLSAAEKHRIEKVTLGIMLGKAVKLAAGHLDTHSKKAVLDKDFLCRLATEAGCSPMTHQQIQEMTLARELWTRLSEEDRRSFFTVLLQHCYQYCRTVFSGKLELLLISDDGEIWEEA